MEPTLRNHEVKVAVRDFQSLRRGEIVIFRHGGESYVKRVALLPGDHVTAYLYNGKWSFPVNRVDLWNFDHAGTLRKDFVVPPNSVFVLGDNWYVSVDSRSFGVIPIDSIGAVVLDSTTSESDLLGVRRGTLQSVTRHDDHSVSMPNRA
jgi:signal peptidase I